MFWRKRALLFGLGYDSSVIVQGAENNAERFCMDFGKIYYPKAMELSYEYKDEIVDADDFWWIGEYVFEKLKPQISTILTGKKKIIIVATKMGQKEAGFVNSLIEYAQKKEVFLITNRNRIDECMYRYFSNICTTMDTFYTEEYKEKIYDKEFNIKPHTSILEMEARLNLSYMKRIEEALNMRFWFFTKKNEKDKKDSNITDMKQFAKKKEQAKFLETFFDLYSRKFVKVKKRSHISDARERAQKIIEDAKAKAETMLSESSILKAAQEEADRIREEVIADCEEIKRKALEEAEAIRKQALEETQKN